MSSWWKALVLKTKRFVRSHPIQLVVLGLFVGIMAAQTAMVVTTYTDQAAARARIEKMPKITLSELDAKAKKGEVVEIVSHDIRWGSLLYPEHRSFLEVVDKKGVSHAWERSSGDVLGDEVGKRLTQNSIDHPITFKTGSVIVPNALTGLLMTVVMLMSILMILAFGQKMVTEVIGGHSFNAQKPDNNLMLDDVIGYPEVKRELWELKDQLLHASAYAERGIVAPRGLLFTGDPGVGKTMMAKAFANEINADFFVCTGADFAEMYVGVGPRRVRGLFRLARLSAVSVIFIDEIDALGSRDQMGHDSERLATINAMLSELDGVNGNGRLVVIGATNNPQKLDPALRRPGRFDKSIHIPLPDTSTRAGILERYLRNVPVDGTLDLQALALRTQGYSGAQLKNIVAEAKQLAARESGGGFKAWALTQDTLERAQEIALLGVHETQSDGEDLIRVAVHELGHALAGYMLCHDIHIEKVTVRGRGSALGYALSRPLDDKKLLPARQMMSRLVMMLSGRAAEEVILGDVTAGAADDLKKANQLARQMVLEYGMGEFTQLSIPQASGSNGTDSWPDTAMSDIAQILKKAYYIAKDLVKDHSSWIETSAIRLMEKGQLGHDELFAGLEKKASDSALPVWGQAALDAFTISQNLKPSDEPISPGRRQLM